MIDAIHPELSFALDVADKAIKAAAVLLGGVWTYWNYKKSRMYKKKLELILEASIFSKGITYYEVRATQKNLGAGRHRVEQEGSYCEVTGISPDLSEEMVDLRPVFTRNSFIEPSESMSENLAFRFPKRLDHLVWLRIRLRVVSEGVEWQQDELIRVSPSENAHKP